MERLENEERARRRQEVIELQKAYFQASEDKKKEEEYIEQLTQLESEKQWKMREDKWRKEDNARLNLMKDVYDNRLTTVETKKRFKDQKQWEADYEKNQILKEIEDQNRYYEEKELKEVMNKKQHQGDVLRQVGERDRDKRRDLQQRMYDERAAKLAEIEYVKKIS